MDDRVERVSHLVRYRCVYNLLERFLSLDLLVKDTESDVFEVNDICVLSIVLDLLLEDAEYELLLVLLLIGIEVDVCILVPTGLRSLTLEKFPLDRLFSLLKRKLEVSLLPSVMISNDLEVSVISDLALVLNAHQFNGIR